MTGPPASPTSGSPPGSPGPGRPASEDATQAPADVRTAWRVAEALRAAARVAWVGDDEVLERVLTSVIAGGHLLLEDVPGVGKTTLARALARALGGRFARVQFTADLLPGDVTGVTLLDRDGGDFVFRPGPLFAHVVLADEINRGPPRTQSALLEAMAEAGVTVDGVRHALPEPFWVVATQNPHDLHGTWPLPESQLDRFLMRLSLGYPSREEERRVLRQPRGGPALPDAVTSPEELSTARGAVDRVRVDPAVEDHLLDLVWSSRADVRLARGISPRGSRALHRACRARALVAGRAYVIPEDVRFLALPVLAHRVVPRSAEVPAEAVLASLVGDLRPPR